MQRVLLSSSSSAAAATTLRRTTAGGASLLFLLLLLSLQVLDSNAWGSSSSSSSTGDGDSSLFGNSLGRDWLYDGSAISVKLEGCMWGLVPPNENNNKDKNNNNNNNNNRNNNNKNQNGGDSDFGCMENSSEDGTTYWYQMANCRRAQAVFSMYSSSTGSASCNSGYFKEAFVTKYGLSEFIHYIEEGNVQGGDDVQYDDAYDGGNDGGDNYDDLPMCEQVNGNYVGLGCADDGSFALLYYSDYYCLAPTGSTYNKLKQLNNKLKKYKTCTGVGGGNEGAEDGGLAEMLISMSESCTSLDSSLCSDNYVMQARKSQSVSHSASSSSASSSTGFLSNRTWMTKLKYVAGGLLLLASFVMFTGILFTNRRRRRALMQRRYKQSRGMGRDDRSRRSKTTSGSRSKSKSREKSSSSRRRSRSKSAPKSSSSGAAAESGGIFT